MSINEKRLSVVWRVYYKLNPNLETASTYVRTLRQNYCTSQTSRKNIDSNGSELERFFQQLIDGFYTQLAFSGDENNFFNAKYSLVDQVIDYHTGIPVTLSIVFSAIANQLGFNVAGVNFPGHFLIRFSKSGKAFTLYRST
ncbi:transglutaminase family protein [Alteromonas sp. M12]|uniref:transglutaminase family protein n=1 Tax=Alteromonas sp. M12 TaxID=3135644 RepID=UPI00319E372A